MNLRELRSEVRNHILRDVSDAVGEDDTLYGDRQIDRYLNEGYGRVMNRLLTITKDASSDLQFTLSAGTRKVTDFPKNVRAVKGVRIITSDGGDYTLTKHDEVPNREGTPIYYSMSANAGTLTVGPYPKDEATIQVSAAMAPGQKMVQDTDVPVGLMEDYHLMLADWAAYRCMSNHDVDRDEMMTPKASQRRNEFNRALTEVLYVERRKQNWPIGFGSEFKHAP